MKARDFLSLHDITADEMLETFRIAAELKAAPARYSGMLKGKVLALLFEKPSLRTRVSFEVGIHQLGGHSIYLSPAEVGLGKRESVRDVAKNLERMVQGIVVRTFAHQIVLEMADHAAVPVINALTDYSHPCQGLSDYFTIKEVKGRLRGLKLCYVGDGNNVAHSLLFGGARLGVNVTVACPAGFEPDGAAVRQAIKDAEVTGARIEIVRDPREAVKDADIVYTDVWASMGRESEAETRREVFRPYQVNEDLMALAKADSIFMHCLPAHRGEEVTDGVIDAPYSVVFQQAENRLHVQKALMLQLIQ